MWLFSRDNQHGCLVTSVSRDGQTIVFRAPDQKSVKLECVNTEQAEYVLYQFKQYLAEGKSVFDLDEIAGTDNWSDFEKGWLT